MCDLPTDTDTTPCVPRSSNLILLEPLAGLGNRMRALDSAIALSKRLDKPLHVLWRQDRALNSTFEDLFIVPESIQSISNLVLEGPALSAQLADLLHILFDRCIDQECIESLRGQKYDFADLVGLKAIFISTYSRFYDSGTHFRDLVPRQALQQMIDSYARDLENAVGVHIRRTDNVRAREKSPTARFIEQMEKEVQDDDDRVRFFLATDSPDEEVQLKAIFSDRIFTHPKRSLNRNDSIAAQDAVIDLFCLSKCRKLLGSYWSSFSDTAVEINGIPRVIIQDG
jgi:hypothetical protein